jgi:hypothetical protein
MTFTVRITRDGKIRYTYNDDHPLNSLGRPLAMTRASNVNWDRERQGWTLEWPDGRPMASEVFARREDAIRHEIKILDIELRR